MTLNVSFCKMFEPGEFAPPQFKEEYFEEIDYPVIPRHTDQIIHNGKKYFVYDVVYDMDKKSIDLRATRKVRHAWELE